MKTTLDFNDFRDAFRRYDRMDNFSREGMQLLFDYCEECDPDMDLDVIALCCDYDELQWDDIAANYRIDLDDCEDEDDKIEVVREYLEANTQLIGETATGFVYAVF
jgi:hypothetical protein